MIFRIQYLEEGTGCLRTFDLKTDGSREQDAKVAEKYRELSAQHEGITIHEVDERGNYGEQFHPDEFGV